MNTEANPVPGGRKIPRGVIFASEQSPCPVCRGVSERSWNTMQIACLNTAGTLSEYRLVRFAGKKFHVHPRNKHTGEILQPVPETVRTFINCLFEPDDVILIRPIEAWNEENSKRSRVVFREISYMIAEGLATDPEAWADLQHMAEQERANVFFGVVPRFGGWHYDLAWQARTVRCLWADLDHCSVEEAKVRLTHAGIPLPTVIVRSGNGVHLYWRLTEPVMIDDAGDPPPVKTAFIDRGPGRKKQPRKCFIDPRTKKKVHDLRIPLSPKATRVQAVVAGIADSIAGDHTHDLARLLRLPNTLNRKDERKAGHRWRARWPKFIRTAAIRSRRSNTLRAARPAAIPQVGLDLVAPQRRGASPVREGGVRLVRQRRSPNGSRCARRRRRKESVRPSTLRWRAGQSNNPLTRRPSGTP